VKVCGVFDDVTSAGKLFHVRAAATGNARSIGTKDNVSARRHLSQTQKMNCTPFVRR